MDHQLEESLNLDSAMLEINFEQGGDAVTSSDMVLPSTSHDQGIQMEFEHIEEEPVMMESGNEEMISMMSDQFAVCSEQDYGMQDTHMLATNVDSDQAQLLKSSGMIDLQFDTQQLITSTIASRFDSNQTSQAQLIPLKPLSRTAAPLPRQVAIAPKPAPAARQVVLMPPGGRGAGGGGGGGGAGAGPAARKLALQGVKQGKVVMHTQMGKQFVMMPAQNGQKFKLVQGSAGAGGQALQAQLVSGKGGARPAQRPPIVAKLIVQGQPRVSAAAAAGEQPAVITRLSGAGAGAGVGAGAPRFVAVAPQPRQLLSSKIVMASPTKHGIRFSKPSSAFAQSPTKYVAVTKKPGGGAPRQLVIKPQRVVLKTTIPHQAQTIKLEPGTVVSGTGSQQAPQIHSINVPGVGVQYIRLITNSTSAAAPSRVPAAAAAAAPAAKQPNTFVLAGSKGKIIQMSADKVVTAQPPLVAAGGATVNKVVAKPTQKLVRIAPVSTRTSASAASTMRGQSLLVQPTVTSAPPAPAPALSPAPAPAEAEHVEDSKEALRHLISQTAAEVESQARPGRESPDREDSGSDSSPHAQHDAHAQEHAQEHHPLIVIPAEYEPRDDNSLSEEPYGVSVYSHSARSDEYSPLSPPPPGPENNELVRPRKACNCTKSQCLKLYCDCFASGEFCNGCNCTSCRNNLGHEELRQKAIRGCLDRNPNAFRPKIGKSRNGGQQPMRRHNKGCNCKRSGCLKNYCECYEAKIACTAICKCVGCRNVEEALERVLRRSQHAPHAPHLQHSPHLASPPDPPYREPPSAALKQPCSFITTEVIEAVCQCLVASAGEPQHAPTTAHDPVRSVLDEFARCLQDIISASHQGAALALLDEGCV